MVFIDLLALQHPDQNECDVFVQRKNNTGIINKLPDEKCSILEEVALLTHMTQCNTQAQVRIITMSDFHDFGLTRKCQKIFPSGCTITSKTKINVV